MKRVILVVIMLIGFIGYSQEKSETETSTIEEVVAPYLQKVLGAMETGANFVVAEAPDVIKQYLMYEAVTNWLMVLLSLGFLSFIRIYISNKFTVKSVEEPTSSR